MNSCEARLNTHLFATEIVSICHLQDKPSACISHLKKKESEHFSGIKLYSINSQLFLEFRLIAIVTCQ